eukprot:s8347_g2.t1
MESDDGPDYGHVSPTGEATSVLASVGEPQFENASGVGNRDDAGLRGSGEGEQDRSPEEVARDLLNSAEGLEPAYEYMSIEGSPDRLEACTLGGEPEDAVLDGQSCDETRGTYLPAGRESPLLNGVAPTGEGAPPLESRTPEGVERNKVRRQVPLDFQVRRQVPLDFQVRRQVTLDFQVRRQVTLDFQVRRQVPVDFQVRRQVPMDFQVRRQVPVDFQARRQVPVDFQIRRQVPVDSQVRGQVPLDFQIRRQVPLDFQVRRQVPVDFQVRRQVPMDFQIRCQVPVDSQVRRQVPLDFQVRCQVPEDF